MESNNPQLEEKQAVPPIKSGSKGWLVFLILGIIGILGGIASILVVLLWPEEILPDFNFPQVPSKNESKKYYSNLTGLEVADETAINMPTYCIQTPNGTDGARPQVGLTQAGVVFEAIAEAGITRFAAIYQNSTSAVIGPIRSLRIYYLQWDTPFDCTIVHAGGADDAIAALRAGGYKDLTENYTYMYRGTNSVRRWNNLFTTANNLAQMNADRGYGGSNVTGFTRMTPEEAVKTRVDNGVAAKLKITEGTTENTAKIIPTVTNIAMRFGYAANFNVNYNYDAETNSYKRSYESGNPHEVYVCPNENLGEVNPEDTCTLAQLSPAVVVAMIVEERKASDGYHESITTIGTGEAYVFQNGGVIKGSWSKNSVGEQIKFFDGDGKEIALVPGQTFVEAVPTYGNVEY